MAELLPVIQGEALLAGIVFLWSMLFDSAER
jgi:hypothetical protein